MKVTDDKILKIALITSLIGIIGLIITTPTIEVKEVEIGQITRSMIDEEVAIKGVVENVQALSNGETYILTLTDGTGRIQVVIFQSAVVEIQESETPLDTFKEKHVEVIGTITEYNSKIEIILQNSNSLKIV